MEKSEIAHNNSKICFILFKAIVKPHEFFMLPNNGKFWPTKLWHRRLQKGIMHLQMQYKQEVKHMHY